VIRTTQRRSSISGLVILVAAVALGERAAAEPASKTDRVSLERRLAELKRQARDLQEQIRRVEVELGREPSSAADASLPVSPATPSSSVDCALPFYLDGSGLKRVRSECLEVKNEASCEMPFMLDENGMRRMRPACGYAAPPEESRSNLP
jgi:hypothetical protein